MKKQVLASLALALLAGCAAPPSREALAAADYGPYPENYESIVRSYVAGQLKDPESAQFQFLNMPAKGFYGVGGAKYGYVVCARINAKNGFGGYAGPKVSYFMIRDGRLIDVSIGSAGDYGETISTAKCKPYI